VWVHYIGSAQPGSARQTRGLTGLLQDDAFIASCRAVTHLRAFVWLVICQSRWLRQIPAFFCPSFIISVRDVMQVELLMHIGPEHASLIAWECTSVLIQNIASIFYLHFKSLPRYSPLGTHQ
jgi:hypothetical protein